MKNLIAFTETTTRLKGEIRAITKRGFGFIRENNSRQDIFFHASELVNCEFNKLANLTPVSFLVRRQHDGRIYCVDVQVENVDAAEGGE